MSRRGQKGDIPQSDVQDRIKRCYCQVREGAVYVMRKRREGYVWQKIGGTMVVRQVQKSCVGCRGGRK
jgi:hypothetical protein